MHILFVNYEYPPLGGGGGVVNAWLAEELSKRHEVSVLTSRAFDLPKHEIARNVNIYRSQTYFRRQKAAANIPSMATFLLSGSRMGRELIGNRVIDVINTHFAVPTGPVGAYLSRYGKIPNVLSIHGGDLYDPSKWSSPHRHTVLQHIVRKVVQSADAVVGQSQNTNENLLQFFDRTAKPELIPLGIPRPPPVISGRRALGLDPNETILVTVGRLVGRKGIDQLIRVVSMLRNINVRLIIVGDGPESDALRCLASDLNVADQITFMGFVTNQRKVDLLASADIFVSTSQHEGFGLVFLEAMAQGLPIICYNHGGQTDYLANGVNGAVLPLNELDAFASAVGDLVIDVDSRSVMSARNRSDMEQFFIDNCAIRYEALFRAVTAKNSVSK